MSNADKMISCPPLTRQTAANSSNTRAFVLSKSKQEEKRKTNQWKWHDESAVLPSFPHGYDNKIFVHVGFFQVLLRYIVSLKYILKHLLTFIYVIYLG